MKNEENKQLPLVKCIDNGIGARNLVLDRFYELHNTRIDKHGNKLYLIKSTEHSFKLEYSAECFEYIGHNNLKKIMYGV